MARETFMNWKQLYHLKSYLRTSLWVVPFIAIPLELVATRVLHNLDSWLGWSFMDIGVSGAQAMLNAIITAALSLMVFTFGSLLVALQVASGQLLLGLLPPYCCAMTSSDIRPVYSCLH